MCGISWFIFSAIEGLVLTRSSVSLRVIFDSCSLAAQDRYTSTSQGEREGQGRDGGQLPPPEKQFTKLNQKKEDREVKCIRSGKALMISVYDVLVGDVLHLEPGDLIPADGIFIQGHGLKCDESSATGESDALKKTGGMEVWTQLCAGGPNVKKLDPFIISGYAYPELMAAITEYVRRELVRLQNISDEEIIGLGEFGTESEGLQHLRFGPVRQEGSIVSSFRSL